MTSGRTDEEDESLARAGVEYVQFGPNGAIRQQKEGVAVEHACH